MRTCCVLGLCVLARGREELGMRFHMCVIVFLCVMRVCMCAVTYMLDLIMYDKVIMGGTCVYGIKLCIDIYSYTSCTSYIYIYFLCIHNKGQGLG